MVSSRFVGTPVVNSTRRRNAGEYSDSIRLAAICRKTSIVSARPRSARASRSDRPASSSPLLSNVQRLAIKLPLSTVET